MNVWLLGLMVFEFCVLLDDWLIDWCFVWLLVF